MVAACRLNHYSSGNWQHFPAVNTERTVTRRRHNCLSRAHREAWLLEATVRGHASSIQHSSQQRGWQARVGMASQGALEQTRMCGMWSQLRREIEAFCSIGGQVTAAQPDSVRQLCEGPETS